MDVWGQTTLERAGFPTVLDLVSSRDVQNEATLLNSGCQRTPDLQIRTNVFLIGPDRYGQPASGLYRPPARSFPSPPTRTAVSTPTCPAFKDTLTMMERGSTRRRYLTAGKRIERVPRPIRSLLASRVCTEHPLFVRSTFSLFLCLPLRPN